MDHIRRSYNKTSNVLKFAVARTSYDRPLLKTSVNIDTILLCKATGYILNSSVFWSSPYQDLKAVAYG